VTNSITPPPELLQLWFEQHYAYNKGLNELFIEVARYGADRELEACCEWLHDTCVEDPEDIVPELRAARRPKPPSLKEEALEALQFVDEKLDLPLHNHCNAIHTIRRALEALDA
jgi:hypothetical protein